MDSNYKFWGKVMEPEFRRAIEEIKRDQKERTEKAKLKLERERKLKEEAYLRRLEVEESQRLRRIAAAEAAAAKEEEDRLKPENFSCILKAIPFEGTGDKIKLPPSCFTELSTRGAFDKGPMYFSISMYFDARLPFNFDVLIPHNDVPTPSIDVHKDIPFPNINIPNLRIDAPSTREDFPFTYNDPFTPKITHAGVLEFTAEEGYVALPLHCWNNLFPTGAPSSAKVEVKYASLPKGTYAKLQSIESGFSRIPNHKAVLETSVRQHATLSNGDILTVKYSDSTYHLRVLELKPSSSVSIFGTDIEFDIIGPDPFKKFAWLRSNHPALKLLIPGKPVSSSVDEGKFKYYKFFLSTAAWKKISSKEAKLVISLDQLTEGEEVDLYVTKHPNLFPTLDKFLWSSHDMGSKSLVLTAEDRSLRPGYYYTVAVHGLKGTSRFSVSVVIEDYMSQ